MGMVSRSEVYSLGFASMSKHAKTEKVDAKLFEISKAVSTKSINLGHPTHAEKLISIAYLHFGADFGKWVNTNVRKNPFLDKRKLDFINDILGFIRIGKMKYPVSVWGSMLQEDKCFFEAPNSGRLLYDYSKEKLPCSTTDVLKTIVSGSEANIKTLLDIMNLLFGIHETKEEQTAVKVTF